MAGQGFAGVSRHDPEGAIAPDSAPFAHYWRAIPVTCLTISLQIPCRRQRIETIIGLLL